MKKAISLGILLFLNCWGFGQSAFQTGEVSLDSSYLPFDKEHAESMLVLQASTNLSKRIDVLLSINTLAVYNTPGKKIGGNYLLGIGSAFSVFSNHWLGVKLTATMNFSNYLHLLAYPYLERERNFSLSITPLGIYKLPFGNRNLSVRAGVLLNTPIKPEVHQIGTLYERVTGHPFIGIGYRLGSKGE